MATKKSTPHSQKEVIIDSFLLNQPMYDMTPPPPLPFPKLYYYSLDPARHYHHRFTPAFISSTKPLLIGADLGLPVDELILFSKDYNSTEGILDEEDEALIKETLMDVGNKKKQ